MFALVNDKELILGPIQFNYRLINSALEEDLEIDYRVSPSDYLNVPIVITEKIRILNVSEDKPSYNAKYENLTAYKYEVLDNEVVFYYEKQQIDLSVIKKQYKNIISNERWKRENYGNINFLLNDEEIKISTSRENRSSLINKIAIGTSPYNFKFADKWFEVTSEDLRTILNKIDEKIQQDFNWEFQKIQEIDACTTTDELEQIDYFNSETKILNSISTGQNL
jgi:hypothetical protein